MSKYTELLKDPLWQKKRLEIMSRDEWECRECHDKEQMLVVHHKYYIKGKMPWQYPDKAYVTLCHYCHSELHRDEKTICDGIIQNFKRSDFSLVEVWALSNMFTQIEITTPDERFITSLRLFLSNPQNQQLILDQFENAPIETKIELALIEQNV